MCGGGDVSDYEFDVFLSYRRAGTVRPWVHDHFHPLLVKCLIDWMEREPRVFLDRDAIDVGDQWPERLADAHSRSRLVVAVWTPSYFGSKWCVAEWRSMLERQQQIRLAACNSPAHLVFPVQLKDGESFPDDARAAQSWDMKKWNVSSEAFSQTAGYVDFERKVDELAQRLTKTFDAVPAWRPDWPLLGADPMAPRPAMLPRL